MKNENRVKIDSSSMYLVVDGSAKKLAFGVGGIEVMPLMSVSQTAFEEEFFSPISNSQMAELMAISKGIEYAAEKLSPLMTSLYIFVDQDSMQRLFSHNGTQFYSQVPPAHPNVHLINDIRNKILALTLSKGVQVNILYLSQTEKDAFPNYTFWENLAHLKSRSFLNKVNEIFDQDASPLLEKTSVAKLSINRAADNVRKGFVLKGTRFALNLFKDENGFFLETKQTLSESKVRVQHANNLVNAIFHSLTSIRKELSEIQPDLSPIHFMFYGDFSNDTARKEIAMIQAGFSKNNKDGQFNDVIERSAELLELITKGTVRFSQHTNNKNIKPSMR